MHTLIKNQQGKMPFKMVILGLIIITVLATSGLILIDKVGKNAPKRQINNKPFDIQVPVNYTQPLIIAVFDNVLQIKPVNAKSSKMIKTAENTIKYIEAYPNTDIEQIKYPNKLKESLILKSPNHPDRFEYKINLDDYLWEMDAEGNIIFRDKESRDFFCIKSDDGSCVPEKLARNLLDKHQKVFKIPAPYMIELEDKGNEWKIGVERGGVETKIEDNKLILIPDQEWLSSHVYPIILDPTVEQIPEPSLETDEDGFIPTEIKKWQNSEQSTQFKKRIGGAIANYERENGTWAKIDNTWVRENEDLFVNNTDMLKTKVSSDGETRIDLTWGNETYTVSQKLEKLVWLDTETEDLTDIYDSVNWQIPEVQDNKINWTEIFSGIDYAVEKENSQVPHKIFFKPEFLSKAVNQYDQMSEQKNIALGNMLVYELINVDKADEPIGNVDERIFKDLGAGHTFKLFKQYLHFPGEHEQKLIPVMQKWIKQDNKIYCIEYVMMDEIKSIHQEQPEATIWHNDSTVISGTTNTEDSSIFGNSADINAGANATLYNVWNASYLYRTLFRALNLDTELGVGATITAASASLKTTAQAHWTNVDYSVMRVFKPWVEGDETWTDNDDGDVTYNDWASDASEWGTAGADNANDGGSDNSGDGTDYDRKATAESTVTVTSGATNTWFTWTISNALAQGWYDGTYNENGVAFVTTNTAVINIFFYSSENGTEANNPYWTFTYDVVSNATPSISSATDTPDPTNPNRSVTFTVDWNDADAGDLVKVKICKAAGLTNQVCDSGHWASSTSFATTDPISFTYDVVAGDHGQTRDYSVYVCDDEAACSSASSSTFGVNAQSSVPNIDVRGGVDVR